ncbi:hypothetical protein F2Q70_00026397 [Brassica cretica]|uniref:Uncharacterized protein n=1 Tax=Brassica cretica TaxID=69181 RepID=A0A8S9LE28_BRACR|nr:hypothetical protein F2Q70_00026397 [Brassica cretica]
MNSYAQSETNTAAVEALTSRYVAIPTRTSDPPFMKLFITHDFNFQMLLTFRLELIPQQRFRNDSSRLQKSASTFRGLLKSGNTSQSVMVIIWRLDHSIFKPHRSLTYIFAWNGFLGNTRGNLYLNSTPATKFYFDTELPEIKEFTSRNINSTAVVNLDWMMGIQTKDWDVVAKKEKIELAVDEGQDSATFVVFDKEMTKLTKK